MKLNLYSPINVTNKWYKIKYTATMKVKLGLTCSIVFDITSGQASWVRIWNIEKNAKGKVSNLSRFDKEQNNCIEILDVITNKHIVNMTKVPNFLPGPKILYTNSSNMGEACNNLATLITCNDL